MERVEIVIAWGPFSEPRPATAFTTSTPGLVVNLDQDEAVWKITHLKSGCSLGHYFDGPEQAMFAASQLDGFDWTADLIDDRAALRAAYRHTTDVLGAPETGNAWRKVLNP